MHDVRLMAIFDDKRLGFVNNNLLTDNAVYLGQFSSEPLYDLFKITGEKNRYCLLNGNTSITFDVFEMPRMIAANLSMYYGATGYSHIRINKSETIQTPWGEALFFMRDTGKAPKLNNNNLDAFLETGDVKEFEKLCKKKL